MSRVLCPQGDGQSDEQSEGVFLSSYPLCLLGILRDWRLLLLLLLLSYSCSFCFSCCSMPVKVDGLTGWLVWLLSRRLTVLQHAGELKDEQGRGAELLVDVVGALHPIYRDSVVYWQSSPISCLQPRPVWRALHSAPRSGRRGVKSWRCRTPACSPQTWRTPHSAPALRRQTAWWGTRWLSSWPGEVMLLPS